MISTTRSASASGMNGPAGSNQVWVQLIMPKNSIVFTRAPPPGRDFGDDRFGRRDDPPLLGDDVGAALRRQAVQFVQQHLVMVLRARIEPHEGTVSARSLSSALPLAHAVSAASVRASRCSAMTA